MVAGGAASSFGVAFFYTCVCKQSRGDRYYACTVEVVDGEIGFNDVGLRCL